ncbi:helix-turn-helix domain-containing protein [Herbiconiux sp. P15]|uniref:helix-turn-helix domain-containing protein n=1 Tax=Herbiconiux liukaitaii TaxID=3342799 RepID=UPI0035B878F6
MNLQDVVDQLADTLGRSVVINDLQYRPLAASAQGEEIDALRTTTLLRRSAPSEARAYLDRLKVNESPRPMTIELAPFGGRARLAVPVRDENGPLAVLWLITGGLRPLGSADFEAVDAAVLLARDALSGTGRAGHPGALSAPGTHGMQGTQGTAGTPGTPGTQTGSAPSSASGTRAALVARLLADDVHVRRSAFSAAASQHVLERGSGTVVLAIALDPTVSTIARIAFGRHLAALRSTPLVLLGERAGALLLAGRSEHADAAVESARREAAVQSVRLLALGTAHPGRREDDLLPAAERALTAARVLQGLPPEAAARYAGRADISQLGTWLLLDAVAGEGVDLATYSPAAHTLCVGGDTVQRTTIEKYLDAGANVRAACELLHVHRTTLYYRLENMPEVVREALDDGVARSTLHLCLKLVRQWESTGRF